VNLGTTASYAVLAGQTITNTGPTRITGDIGVAPGSSITGFPPGLVSGVTHTNDASATQAQTDLIAAYDDAVSRQTTQDLTGEDLGGLTLTPGVYEFSSDAQLTGTLTLDAQGDPEGVFIFKVGSMLTTASNSRVNLINGARFCRVFWAVASSATLGTGTHFVGHIFAMTSITSNTGATTAGQLLASTGSVTLDNAIITNDVACVSLPTIRIEKRANPTGLTSGPGPVTYTYEVTNPGIVVLNTVSVTDDKLSLVTYVSGDVNDNDLLEPGETWIYTSTTRLNVTTTNTATATGSDNGVTATDTAVVTVAVTRTTATGGAIPRTATPWYNLLVAGAALVFIGAVGVMTRKSHD
jgi:hypothetical protein